ncbi:MAG: N-acetylmuramoyl-L-alanine amidase [Deltaproteobacteria bacterium]|nr:N-acetylmuramoyl-L-alanine amidase [Deltaproteobacteria bacterium]
MKTQIRRSAPRSLRLLGLFLLPLLVGLAGLMQACGEDATNEFCEPDCSGLCCGTDDCSGVCPDLCANTGQVCDEESCACTGTCIPRTCADLGKECGNWSDGCSSLAECGECPGGQSCDANGACHAECVPDCAGRCCGADGCGGVCLDLCADTGQVCEEDSCECTGACTPQSCASLDKECGAWPDGCSSLADCGECPGTQICDDNGACYEECVPNCAERCCGDDGCGEACPDTCADPNGFCDVSTCSCTSVCDYQLSPTTSFRRLDTRSGEKLQAGSLNSFEMAGRDGIPDNAQSVVVRFTVVAPEANGFITAYNSGASTPDASVLNYAADQVTGNTFFVKVGTDKKITVYTLSPTHLIIDVFGYTVEPEAFHAQTPYRLVDTRAGTKPAANSTTCLTVAGINGVPADAKAVSLVMTSVLPEADGSMSAFASGAAAPPTRSLSFGASQATANGSIVQIGADQKICIQTTAQTHFIVDVTGFFESNAAYRTVTPYRKLDETYAADSTNCVQLAGVNGIPSDAQAVAFTLTAVNPSEQGFITVFPKGAQRPVSSNLNHPIGKSTTNGVISKIGDNGEVCFYQLGATRLLVDVQGYWPGMDSCCSAQSCVNPPFIGCSGMVDLISYAPSGSCLRGTCDYGHAVTACGYLCQQDACIAAPSYPYHDRTEWQDPAYPVSSTAWMDINALRYITLHYIGADGVNVSDIPQLLRNSQLDYVINRGYSLGYNSAVSMDGDEWEIRGFDYRCAANGNQAVNVPSYSIMLALPNTWSVPTEDQIAGVRNLVAKIRATAAAAGNSDFLEVNGHRDLKATSCPGDVIYAMIQNGTFEP